MEIISSLIADNELKYNPHLKKSEPKIWGKNIFSCKFLGDRDKMKGNSTNNVTLNPYPKRKNGEDD